MKYKIIWVIDALKPGGAEQLMPALLSHFNSDTFEMRVCVLKVKTGNPLANELEKIGIPVDVIKANSLKNPLNLFKLLKYFNEHQPDLIHTQLQYSDILGNIAAKLQRKPSVSTLHTLDNMNDQGLSLLRKKIKWFVLRTLCNQIITVSNKTKGHYVDDGKLPKDRVKTIYNGIQISRFQKRDSAQLTKKKQALNLNPKHKIITTISVLREPKGVQYMVDAMTSILEKNPDVTYLLVGDGAYGASLRDLISDRYLQDHIVMAGHRTDIPDMLAISDLFVLPSLGDALPTVLIEALASGTPTIATDVGGIPEIIEHNKNGLLVPPANAQMLTKACLQLLNNKEEASRLSNAGLEIAKERFSVEKQVELLGNIYMELINPNG